MGVIVIAVVTSDMSRWLGTHRHPLPPTKTLTQLINIIEKARAAFFCFSIFYFYLFLLFFFCLSAQTLHTRPSRKQRQKNNNYDRPNGLFNNNNKGRKNNRKSYRTMSLQWGEMVNTLEF